jgi:alpha-beta hydrolase superfamily lysophospholipase
MIPIRHEAGSGGFRIVLDERGSPQGRPVALLGHAMMTNRRSLDRPPGRGLASFFAERNWHVFTVDMPGHGEAGPGAAEGADWTYDDLVAAMGCAIEFVHRRRPDAPLVVLGHSLCSHLTINARGLDPRLPVAAIVAFSGGVWLPRWEPSRWFRWRKRWTVRVMQWVVARAGRLPVRRLRLGNADESRSYLAQLSDMVEADRWRSGDGKVDYVEATARCDVPTLGVIAAGDRFLSRPDAVCGYYAHVGSAASRRRVTTMLARGRDKGLARDPDHMSLVTDPSSRPFWEEAATWVEGVVGPDGRAGQPVGSPLPG